MQYAAVYDENDRYSRDAVSVYVATESVAHFNSFSICLSLFSLSSLRLDYAYCETRPGIQLLTLIPRLLRPSRGPKSSRSIPRFLLSLCRSAQSILSFCRRRLDPTTDCVRCSAAAAADPLRRATVRLVACCASVSTFNLVSRDFD